MSDKILVIYFSRSGNTRVIAGQLKRELNASLFEIEPAKPYPEDYEETVAEAKRESDNKQERALAGTVPDIGSYDTVFLGFPIWGETMPPVVKAFLSTHDLSGKTIIPFITHGGYGIGESATVMKTHASKANVLKGFVIEADQERRTMTQVREWLSDVKSKLAAPHA